VFTTTYRLGHIRYSVITKFRNKMIKTKAIDISAPFKRSDYKVKPEWIDHNGHMNVTFYLEAFDHNIGDFFRSMGLTKEYRHREGVATYCGDFHIHYIRELFEGIRIEITCQLVDFDEKRIHLCQSMFNAEEGYLAAEAEVIYLHVDAQARKVAPMKSDLFDRMQVVYEAHKKLGQPGQKGRTISIKKRV